ncbi:patatin-like protein [Sphingorhabdus sp. Alg239-R122]|uniref:patatin-like protein n=1 Tax=Sphingorhabdus sp. Alg239-R122 TaxID=2305989 RepID=UPI0013D9678F|nr:patatin-like protein [Sphingorhabdus sp. Alg239-R122]
MRQRELRIALICYGGISLAVYMHGITKEVWRLARASRNFHDGTPKAEGSQGVYRDLFEHIARKKGLKMRFLPDIITGASAGGINGVFLAQAIATGQSLEPLTRLWLDCADIDVLLDPDARPFSRFSKFWAQPIAWFALSRKGGAVERTVAKETQGEVKSKMSSLIRARWFAPPFSGTGFSTLLYNATEAMAESEEGPKLLPDGQPLDLFVTVTDFHGHLQHLRLHSPRNVVETEHRLTIGFRKIVGSGRRLAERPELVFAARATASFPGAFPAFNVKEIDKVVARKQEEWPNRDVFLKRILPRQYAMGTAEDAVLIDGSVLANAPFSQAVSALRNRPAHREIDRRFVYIDPKPDFQNIEQQKDGSLPGSEGPPGFFSTIFGAISDIPREQPIRDDLELIEARSNRILRMRQITQALRSEVEAAVNKLFGRTFFLNSPTTKRLIAWRRKAQQKAATQAGYTYSSYGHIKLAGIADEIAATLLCAYSGTDKPRQSDIRDRIMAELTLRGLGSIADDKGGATDEAITFFRTHDLGFRIRRLRFLARRLSEDIAANDAVPGDAVVAMQDTIYACLSRYLEREGCGQDGKDFSDLAKTAFTSPARAIDELGQRRDLITIDAIVDEKIATALELLPKEERRSLLLAYLGFPFYDIATLSLLQGEGLNEFDPIKVDRISPDDAQAIRAGGAEATLKGIEFNSFGAFFSRAYRENDYLWGRLHGAERMIDLITTSLESNDTLEAQTVKAFKKAVFLAILDEEADLNADPSLIPAIRGEIEERL